MNLGKKIYPLLYIIIILAALYCYNPFVLYFQNDDFIHIPLSEQGVLLQRNTFRPVCDISIMVDYWLWGKNAWGYHLTNLLLHILVCVILFFFLKFILKKHFGLQQTALICWLSCGLFFIYSMHSEAVFWILGRSAILSAIFSLLFLFCYLKKYDTSKYVVGYIFFFILSLLTYESSWILPLYCLIAGIAEIRNKQSLLKQEVTHFAIVIGIFVFYLIIRWHYINEITSNYTSAAFSNGEYATLLKNYAALFLRSFLPPFTDNKIFRGCFIVISVTLGLLFLRLPESDRKKVVIFFLCFLISLAPYGSLGVDTNGTESERFLYFPTLVISILFGLIINLSNIKKIFQFALYILILSCHTIVLIINANNYRFAGDINKLIIAELDKVSKKKIIYAIDLPQSQNGALIMRSGFTEMIKWIFNNKFDTAVVCSQRSELKPLQYPYHVIYSIDTDARCANSSLEKNSATFALLRFTDSTIYISK